MKITHGLMTGQVLQRDPTGNGGALISVSCSVAGNVEMRVLKAGKVVRGHDWEWSGVFAESDGEEVGCLVALVAVPTGGPYRVEMRVKRGRKVVARVAVDEIFVGDIWVLAGQSNMEGIGNLAHAPKPHPMVRAFYMRDEWGIAQEALHYLSEAVDIVHNGYGNE